MQSAQGCPHVLCRLCHPSGAPSKREGAQGEGPQGESPQGESPQEGAVDPQTSCLACGHTLAVSRAILDAIQRVSIYLLLGFVHCSAVLC